MIKNTLFKTVEDTIETFEQYKSQRNQKYASIQKISSSISDYAPPILKLTNSEYAKLAKGFLESDAYIDAVRFINSAETKTSSCLRDMRKEIADGLNRLISEARNLSTGVDGENRVLKDLKSLLPEDMIIFNNLHLNGVEHDILVLGKTGLFTIEVKTHAGAMEWDELGRYTEYSPIRRGQRYIIKDAVDPYLQTRSHCTSLKNFLSSIDLSKLSTTALPIVGLVTVANNISVKTDYHCPRPVHGIVHTASVIESQKAGRSLLTKSDISYLKEVITKNMQQPRKYEFYDVEEIEKFLSPIVADLSSQLDEFETIVKKTATLNEKLHTLRVNLDFEAHSLRIMHWKEVLDEDAKSAPIPYLFGAALCLVLLLFYDPWKIIGFSLTALCCTFVYFRIKSLIKRNKKYALEFDKMGDRIESIIF